MDSAFGNWRREGAPASGGRAGQSRRGRSARPLPPLLPAAPPPPRPQPQPQPLQTLEQQQTRHSGSSALSWTLKVKDPLRPPPPPTRVPAAPPFGPVSCPSPTSHLLSFLSTPPPPRLPPTPLNPSPPSPSVLQRPLLTLLCPSASGRQVSSGEERGLCPWIGLESPGKGTHLLGVGELKG